MIKIINIDIVIISVKWNKAHCRKMVFRKKTVIRNRPKIWDETRQAENWIAILKGNQEQ